MMLWGLEYRGTLEPVALNRRKYVQIYAGRRFLAVDEFRTAYGRDDANEFEPFGNAAAAWKACKRRHPTLRIVRVEVR